MIIVPSNVGPFGPALPTTIPVLSGQVFGGLAAWSSAFTVTRPSVSAGNLIIVAARTKQFGGAIATPTNGFAIAPNGAFNSAGGNVSEFMAVFSKIATASEPSTYTFDMGGAIVNIGTVVLVFSNVSPTPFMVTRGNAVLTQTAFPSLTSGTTTSRYYTLLINGTGNKNNTVNLTSLTNNSMTLIGESTVDSTESVAVITRATGASNTNQPLYDTPQSFPPVATNLLSRIGTGGEQSLWGAALVAPA